MTVTAKRVVQITPTRRPPQAASTSLVRPTSRIPRAGRGRRECRGAVRRSARRCAVRHAPQSLSSGRLHTARREGPFPSSMGRVGRPAPRASADAALRGGRAEPRSLRGVRLRHSGASHGAFEEPVRGGQARGAVTVMHPPRRVRLRRRMRGAYDALAPAGPASGRPAVARIVPPRQGRHGCISANDDPWSRSGVSSAPSRSQPPA
jgi:hypothetical protein